MMNDTGRKRGQRCFKCGRIDLCGGTRKRHQFRTAGKHLGRSAFVDMHMRKLMAHHGTMRRRQRRQRQCIGRRAGDDRIDRDFAFEKLRKPLAETCRHRVVAVGALGSGIYPGECRQDFRRHPGGIVACEVHNRPIR